MVGLAVSSAPGLCAATGFCCGIGVGYALCELLRRRQDPPGPPAERSRSKSIQSNGTEGAADTNQDLNKYQWSANGGSFHRLESNPYADEVSILLRRRAAVAALESVDEPTRSVSQDTFIKLRKIYGLGGFCTHSKLMLCMVGLPARGKSYISNMLMRYLSWTGFPVRSFNAGQLRRQDGLASVDASWFSNDENKSAARELLATRCMKQALQWLREQDNVSVAIFDATNSTKKRRQMIWDACSKIDGVTCLFLESICDDPQILKRNYRLKLMNEDYKEMDHQKAEADFEKRVKQYQDRYETVEDDEMNKMVRYIKIYNIGQKVETRHADGYAASNISFYLSNVHVTPRRIWLARHAETSDGRAGILGSCSASLTERGILYCHALASHVHKARQEMLKAQEVEGSQVLILMGTAPVHKSTLNNLSTAPNSMDVDPSTKEALAAARHYPVMSTSLLNELDGGDCNGMTYDEIQRVFPTVWAARELDKLNFRYPGAGGESYVDVINRLQPVIVELERHHSSLLIISHLAVQRCIYGYFNGVPMSEMPYLEMDMHTVYELNPGPFGTQVQKFPLGPIDMDPPCGGSDSLPIHSCCSRRAP